jgi:cytochrome c oxidase assembly protein subunit 15
MKRLAGKNDQRPVAIWLLIGVGMIVIQVLLGGITRLTGSGLSITEWKPILGTLPPLNEQSWQNAFEQYKTIGQYKHLNFNFTLEDFKFIYFWEWLHRVWGRLIGVVFIIPFIIFILQKKINREMVNPLIILFLLGALQGAVGWIMVKSGLNEENLYCHIRLAVHFITALGLLCYTFWFAMQLLIPSETLFISPRLKNFTVWLTALLTLQLIYGAFMAGLKAATFAPTWPTINGSWWPQGMNELSGLRNLTDNPITVQFIHRGLAYFISILVLIGWFRSKKIQGKSLLSKCSNLLLITVVIQVLLGILTVVHSPDKQWHSGWASAINWLHDLLILFGMLFLIREGTACIKIV